MVQGIELRVVRSSDLTAFSFTGSSCVGVFDNMANFRLIDLTRPDYGMMLRPKT